jgi:ATP-binding cassette subfamily B multidrug efflux pump
MTSRDTAQLSRHGLKRLLGLLMTYRRHTVVGMIGVILADTVQLTVPWITKVVVDRLEARSIEIPELLGWGGLILALGGVSFLSKRLWRLLILGASKKIEADLRRQLLEKTLAMTVEGARTRESGKFMSLASNDIPAVGQAVAFGLIAFFDCLFITGVAVLLMMRLSPTLTAWAMVPFPILGLFLAFSMKGVYTRWDQAQESLELVTEKTRESLSGMRTLRSYVQQAGDIASFEQKNRDYLRDMMAYVRVDATFSPLILLFAGSSSAVLLFVGGKLVLNGAVSVGDLAAFIGYLSILTWPMIAAGWMLVLLQRGSASMDRLDEILGSESEPASDGVTPLTEGTLEVRDLSFAYPGGAPVLRKWSFCCAPGQVIGIVGPVGSGKSTVLRLLQALEPMPAGSIFVAGQDLAALDKTAVRRLFSPVSQEPFLFSDTIANNLRLGNPAATEEELRQAVDVADLKADLAEFPQGLETELGERGVSLSGGQKQRAALGRAWLKPSPFLLLDDTLSAVDTLTEQRILRHLKDQRERHRRGVIVVSHRLSALKDADLILVTRDGAIVDRGTHEELAARPGLYADLLKLQDEGEDALV